MLSMIITHVILNIKTTVSIIAFMQPMSKSRIGNMEYRKPVKKTEPARVVSAKKN